MSHYFLNPTLLYLAPLMALPILIHLLNRIRYRRVRWAAMAFLLSTERRAVRRARLQQILLMILRTLLLAAALLALAQPIFRGGLARFLGAEGHVAVLLDASASMGAADASGAVFARAKTTATDALRKLPSGARAVAGRFAANYDSPFVEPVADTAAAAATIESFRITGGRGDVPRALRAAAEALARAGGGGAIWLLTDLQASGWRADDAGAWDEVRHALQQAGNPRLLLTNTAPDVHSNVAVGSVRLSPAVLRQGDMPRVTVALTAYGEGEVSTGVSLFFDGKRVDARTVSLQGRSQADCVFHLPALSAGAHTATVALTADMLPGDDRYDFVIRTDERIDVLLVDGAPSAAPFAAASAFLALAIEPLASEFAGRSIFRAQTLAPQNLSAAALKGMAAVFLAGVRALSAEAAEGLRGYVNAGGLLVIFPPEEMAAPAWNKLDFLGVTFQALIRAEEKEKPIRISWVSPNHPATRSLATEGIGHTAIQRMFKLVPRAQENALAATDRGDAFLTQAQAGKGKVYCFAVSAQLDSSDLPLNPTFLPLLHRLALGHIVGLREPPAREVFAELKFPLPPGEHQVATPDGRLLPPERMVTDPGRAVFSETEQAGVYRLISGDNPGVPIAALNVPREEAELERIAPERVRVLLGKVPVSFMADPSDRALQRDRGDAHSAVSGFSLAALALLFLLGEVLLAWSLRRPVREGKQQ